MLVNSIRLAGAYLQIYAMHGVEKLTFLYNRNKKTGGILAFFNIIKNKNKSYKLL